MACAECVDIRRGLDHAVDMGTGDAPVQRASTRRFLNTMTFGGSGRQLAFSRHSDLEFTDASGDAIVNGVLLHICGWVRRFRPSAR